MGTGHQRERGTPQQEKDRLRIKVAARKHLLRFFVYSVSGSPRVNPPVWSSKVNTENSESSPAERWKVSTEKFNDTVALLMEEDPAKAEVAVAANLAEELLTKILLKAAAGDAYAAERLAVTARKIVTRLENLTDNSQEALEAVRKTSSACPTFPALIGPHESYSGPLHIRRALEKYRVGEHAVVQAKGYNVRDGEGALAPAFETASRLLLAVFHFRTHAMLSGFFFFEDTPDDDEDLALFPLWAKLACRLPEPRRDMSAKEVNASFKVAWELLKWAYKKAGNTDSPISSPEKTKVFQRQLRDAWKGMLMGKLPRQDVFSEDNG